jgi:hypothetical protein
MYDGRFQGELRMSAESMRECWGGIMSNRIDALIAKLRCDTAHLYGMSSTQTERDTELPGANRIRIESPAGKPLLAVSATGVVAGSDDSKRMAYVLLTSQLQRLEYEADALRPTVEALRKDLYGDDAEVVAHE